MLDKGRKGESDKYVLDFPIVVCKPLNCYHFDGKTFESSSECFFGLEVNRTVRKRTFSCHLGIQMEHKRMTVALLEKSNSTSA